ncbi:MAG: division/cell wall cluster transcriptional repressor MraZ [Deltaproteobacteria bacterium]|nr:division/cell wall cluster transcriptional repressor MraZ [Deltaproteobacteria bacterium]
MFRGRFEYILDTKGRLAIPAKFREILTTQFDERLIITNYDECLWAYPVPVWQELEKKVSKLPQFLEEVKALQRVFISAACECPLDKQGRILLPQSLRDYAGLSGESLRLVSEQGGEPAVLVGMTQRIEIWSRVRWNKAFDDSKKQLSNMQEKLAELGI